MSTNRDEWVRVESEDELQPGMAVQLRPCLWCGKVETFLIGREVACDPVGVNPDGTTSPTMGVRAFEILARACKDDRTPSNYGRAIAQGRVYRLRDLPAEETVRRARRTDRNHAEIRDVLRSLCPVVEDTSDVGRGFPDLVVRTRAGTVLLVEVKDGQAPPSRQRLTPDEAAFANRWQSSYVIVSSVDEAIAVSRK